MVRVTSQGSEQVASSTSQGSEQGQQRIRQEQRAGTGYRAQENTTPRQSLQVWP
ncbi:unnamed protein product, partial [Staurois parvus]